VALNRNPLVALEVALQRSQLPLRVVWETGDVMPSRKSTYLLDRTFPYARGMRIIDEANLYFPEELTDVIAEEALRVGDSV
jgi:DNA helicase HerA-like ATPase